jgi:uncharacterized peroxidase-related enzyme
MAWIKTIPPAEASGQLREIYEGILRTMPFVPKMRQLASLRPEAVEALELLARRAHFGGTSLGRAREERIALVVAALLKCTYCAVAHGGLMVREGKATAGEVTALACNYHQAGLPAADVAMLDYAAKIALDPERITEQDIAGLRAQGFSDVEILDIALNASYRVFVTRMAAALGLEGEEWFETIDPNLRETLTVGRRL